MGYIGRAVPFLYQAMRLPRFIFTNSEFISFKADFQSGHVVTVGQSNGSILFTSELSNINSRTNQQTEAKTNKRPSFEFICVVISVL
jgi:hypothetical protein